MGSTRSGLVSIASARLRHSRRRGLSTKASAAARGGRVVGGGAVHAADESGRGGSRRYWISAAGRDGRRHATTELRLLIYVRWLGDGVSSLMIMLIVMEGKS